MNLPKISYKSFPIQTYKSNKQDNISIIIPIFLRSHALNIIQSAPKLYHIHTINPVVNSNTKTILRLFTDRG